MAYDQVKARRIVEQSIRKEAAAKNRPADLINIALEKVVEVGLCAAGERAEFDAQFFRRQLDDKLRGAAAAADAGYPENDGLVVDPESGVPSLKAFRADGQWPSAKRLEQEIKARMPERSLMGIVARGPGPHLAVPDRAHQPVRRVLHPRTRHPARRVRPEA
ncbi:hypothetical protein ABZ678_34725 [Streptomyces hirsutus]|uniref:hypothetical protein n=1 Tax=Streptomyces hirsutus TaxID=35620 RepID=UPI0033D23A16